MLVGPPIFRSQGLICHAQSRNTELSIPPWRFAVVWATVFAVTLMIGCGSSTTAPTSSSGGSTGGGAGLGGAGTLTAIIDGVALTAASVTAVKFPGDIPTFLVVGADNAATGGRTAIEVTARQAVGTYTVAAIAIDPLLNLIIGNNAYNAIAGRGTVSVSTFTGTTASGAFSFVAQPLGFSGANKNVTAGSFNVRF
jgi:hypothetical protein